MRFAWVALCLAALELCACAGPEPEPFETSLVVQRLTIDGVTQPGELFRRRPELAQPFEDIFELVACTGGQPLALRVEGETTDGQGFGHASLVLTTVVEGEPCDGDGTLAVQPISLLEDRQARVRGPVFIDGVTVDGRIPLGRFQIGSDTLDEFPPRWALTVRGRELAGRGIVLSTGEADTVWPPQQLASVPVMEIGRSVLDVLIGEELQPDVDLDEDGLERWLLEGDRVVGCREAGGEPVPMAECVPANGFVDGYDLRLRFRLVPVTLMD